MIAVENLSIHQGAFALDGITFSVPTGQHAVLMGETGTGKTTILEAICGLRPVRSGEIRLNDVNVTLRKPAERGIGYVPQDGALFHTMTVRQNLAFSMQIRRWPKHAVDGRTKELVALLGIDHLLDRSPVGLSGGEQQRVALGRAIASRPTILCLDEPFSALDDKTRSEMYSLLKTVRQHADVTTLHITHSRAEAEQLGDVLLVLRDGKVERDDTTQ